MQKYIITASILLLLTGCQTQVKEQHVSLPEAKQISFDFSEMASIQDWNVGGWLGKSTAVKATLQKQQGLAITSKYPPKSKETYVQLYRKGHWDLSKHDTLNIKFRSPSRNQRITIILQDSTGFWRGYTGQALAATIPNQWFDVNMALNKPIYPRNKTYANLADITYIAFQISKPGNAEIDHLTFFKNNLLKNGDFEYGIDIPVAWNVKNSCQLDNTEAKHGKQALCLTRGKQESTLPAALSQKFNITKQNLAISGYWKSDKLYSPDPSFNVAIEIELFDKNGNFLTRRHLKELTGSKPWHKFVAYYKVPNNTCRGHIVIKMNKTHGKAWVDKLKVAELPDSSIANKKPYHFKTNVSGNLFYPGKPIKINYSFYPDKCWKSDQQLFYDVRNYKQKRVNKPHQVPFSISGNKIQALLDIDTTKLQIGQYYEVHCYWQHDKSKTFAGKTTFAIMPEAINNQYLPAEIPFGTQGWTMKSENAQKIAKRLGCRWVRFTWYGPTIKNTPFDWKRWQDNHKKELKNILYRPVSMGFRPYYTCRQGIAYERGVCSQSPEQVKENIFQSTRHFSQEGLSTFKLGNEPPEWDYNLVKKGIEGYKALYTGIKKADRNALIIGSSLHLLNDDFLKLGYAKYCDVMDIHLYTNIKKQRQLTRKMLALAKKIGTPRPLWTTEIGSKLLALTNREQAAIDCITKQTVFFADGGVHADWFALQTAQVYRGTYKDAFCMFSVNNEPRLDAIAYFHFINSISIKKFTDEKQFQDGTEAYLFRDNNNNCALITWNSKKSSMTKFTIKNLKDILVIHIDGQKQNIASNQNGFSVTCDKYPKIILFKSPITQLP